MPGGRDCAVHMLTAARMRCRTQPQAASVPASSGCPRRCVALYQKLYLSACLIGHRHWGLTSMDRPAAEHACLCWPQNTTEAPMPGYPYKPLASAGWIWNRTRAVASLGRAYNYPHQTAVYWAAYRVARYADLAPMRQPALWYLRQAARTIRVRLYHFRPFHIGPATACHCIPTGTMGQCRGCCGVSSTCIGKRLQPRTCIQWAAGKMGGMCLPARRQYGRWRMQGTGHLPARDMHRGGCWQCDRALY